MNYTVYDISEMLFIDVETVRRWIRENKLKGFKDSKKEGYVIKLEDLLDFLEKRPKYKKIFKQFIAKNATDIELLIQQKEAHIEILKNEIFSLKKSQILIESI